VVHVYVVVVHGGMQHEAGVYARWLNEAHERRPVRSSEGGRQVGIVTQCSAANRRRHVVTETGGVFFRTKISCEKRRSTSR